MGAHLPERIPLFPLPSTVAFPCVPLPLHIFEPRYQVMVNEALAGPRVIGMTLLKPGWEKDYEGRPPIYPIGCAGIISQVERLADGRFNLNLLGQRVFEIQREETGKPYRIGVVAYRDDAKDLPAADTLKPFRRRVIRLVNAMARAAGRSHEGIVEEHAAEKIPDAEFVNYLCHMLALQPLEKQALLEAEGVEARYRKLIDLLDFHRLEGGVQGGTVQ